MKIVFLLFFLSLIFPVVLPAQCNNYKCKMEMAQKALKKSNYKSALDLARGAESYDPSKKAEVNAFIDQVFAIIEGKRVEAEKLRKKAEISEQKANNANEIAEKEKIEAEKAKTEAIKQKEFALNLLDSLGMFNGREEALVKFNTYKEKGDYLLKINQWDSAHYYLKSALTISDENPFIRVGKKEIYLLIDTCNLHINNRNKANAEILKGESLMKTKGLKNYWNAFNLYSKLDNKYIKSNEPYISKLISEIEDCLHSKDTLCCKFQDNISLKFLLVELYTYQKKDNRADTLITEIRKAQMSERKMISNIYLKNAMLIRSPVEYARILKRDNIFTRAIESDIYVPFIFEFSYGFPFISSNDRQENHIQHKFVWAFRYGYDLKPIIWRFFGKNRPWHQPKRNLNYQLDIEYKYDNFTSGIKDTFLYNSKNGVLILPEVKKQNLIKNHRISFIYTTRYILPLQRNFNSFRPTPTISLGLGVRGTYVIEKYAKNQDIYFSDTTIITSSVVSNVYENPIELLRKNTNFTALGLDAELLCRVKFGEANYSRTIMTYKELGWGIRFSTDYYLFLSKNKSYYKEIDDQYGIRGANKLTLAEFIIKIKF